MLAGALLLGAPGGPPRAQAQPEEVSDERLGVFEGRPVARIELVEVEGEGEGATRSSFDSTTEQRYRNQLRTVEGQPFSVEVARQDQSNLFRLGEFARFRIELEPLSDGSVVVRYLLNPQPGIKDVQIVGNQRLGNRRISELPEVERLRGTPVDRQRIAEAAAAIEDLYKSKGYYRAEVTVDEDELANTGIVLFRVREGSRTRVTDIRFDFGGRGSFTPRQLLPEIKTREAFPLLERAPLDEDALREDADKLTRFYLDRGYLDVEVDFYVRPSPDNAEAIVTFFIDEGRVYTLRSVRVVYPALELPGSYASVEDALDAAPGAMVRRLIEKETGFAPEAYPQDDPAFLQRVREILNLDEPVAPTLPDALRVGGQRMQPDVGVNVVGPGDIRLYEYGVFSPEQIAGIMSIKAGDVYSSQRVAQSIESIRDAYGEMGYITDRRLEGESVDILTRRKVDPATPEVDLIIQIMREGERYRTGEIVVKGNDITRHEVILRETDLLRPDRPLRAPAMARTAERLSERGIRLFAPGSVRVTPQRPDPNDPEYRDVLIEVEETDTGEFNLGGSVNSDFGLSGFLTIRQRNFDISDTPDSAGEFFSNESFLGAGQTFELTLEPGTVAQNYEISLLEPALFETDYSLRSSLFFRANDFDEFDEERYGTNFRLQRRFGTQWVGSASLRIESVKLQDIADSQPVDILEVADRKLVNSIGLGLARTTVPISQRFHPSQGSRTEMSIEQFGLVFGDFNFTRLNIEHKTFLTIYEDFFGRRTVLSLQTQASWVPQGQDAAPVYERFYRGGRTFRGFDFRAVSPVGLDVDGNLTDTPVGGTWQFFLGAELERPLIGDLISLVGFVDSGTVTEEIGFDDYRLSVGAGIRVFVPFLSPAPLAFDFGFPLLKEDTDETRVFTFSIDLEY